MHLEPRCQGVATRAVLRGLYREVLGTPEPDDDRYRQGFVRYIVRHVESRSLLETAQYLFMRVAMGLCLREPDPYLWAQRFYHGMSTLRWLPSTPTLFNAGTCHHQLSSCYLADVHDSMDHIL